MNWFEQDAWVVIDRKVGVITDWCWTEEQAVARQGERNAFSALPLNDQSVFEVWPVVG